MNYGVSGYEARGVAFVVETPGDGPKEIAIILTPQAAFEILAAIAPEFGEYIDRCSEASLRIFWGEE